MHFVRLFRPNDAARARHQDGFTDGVQDAVDQAPFEHMDQRPGARFGAVFPLQPGGNVS